MNIHVERKYKVNKWIIKARWFYVPGILLIGFVTKISQQTNVDFSKVTMIGLAVGVVGLNLLFYIILRNTDIRSKKAARIVNAVGCSQIIFELFILTLIMHYGGGVDSIGIVYFFLPIISASLMFGGSGAVITALTVGIFASSLVVLEYYGIIAHINRYGVATIEFQQLSIGLVRMLSVSIFYIIISIFAGMGAKLLYSREEELSKKNKEAEQANKELDKKIKDIKKSERDTLKAFMDLKRQRELTHEEKNRTAAILSNFIDPIIVIDKAGKISFLNPAAKEIFGFRDSDIGKKVSKSDNYSMVNFKSLLGREFLVKSDRELKIKDSNIKEVTIKIGDENNSYRVTTVPVRESDGDYLGTMKIFYNITREKTLDKLKSDFISIAAHQLRTPLSAIKWAIKMVLDGDAGKLNKEQKLILNKGYASNERIINLINDMLDVSRIEEGRFDYHFEYVDFNDVMIVALVNYDKMISKKKLRVQVNKPKKMPKIYIDKEKIIMVVRNLIANAVEYTLENGKIIIDIEAGKEFFTFTIKDNGVGIPKADQEKIFSKFYRGNNVIRMQTDGSGLGLFIVKNIINKHNGDISFNSYEGRGSEFVITLPIKKPK